MLQSASAPHWSAPESAPPSCLPTLSSSASCSIRKRHNDLVGHTLEDAMLHHADRLFEGSRCGIDIGNGGIERQVNNVVAIVRHCRRLPLLHLVVGAVSGADHRLASLELGKLSNGPHGVLAAKRHNLHRQRKRGPEALAQLRVVDDADELLGHDLHHLLAEERAAASLDEGVVGVDGVGAVDGDVEVGALVEGAEGDVEALGLLAGALRRGDAHDVLELPALELLPDALHREVGGGPRSQADGHAGLDVVVDRLVPGELLGLVGGRHVVGHHARTGGGAMPQGGHGRGGGGAEKGGRRGREGRGPSEAAQGNNSGAHPPRRVCGFS
mmetsp:Transcript_7141/g.17234  ORF Transcript_7141/g.17234 Transcript_7141/m.17234 type:complete len:327 (+) Transcript_7141:1347-2327(+)